MLPDAPDDEDVSDIADIHLSTAWSRCCAFLFHDITGQCSRRRERRRCRPAGERRAGDAGGRARARGARGAPPGARRWRQGATYGHAFRLGGRARPPPPKGRDERASGREPRAMYARRVDVSVSACAVITPTLHNRLAAGFRRAECSIERKWRLALRF